MPDAADLNYNVLVPTLPASPAGPSVTLTLVSSPDDLPNFGNIYNDEKGPYLFAWSHTSYVRDRGLAVQPVGGPARAKASVTRVHGGLCYKLVEWAYLRVLDEPVLPGRDTNNPDDVLVADAVGGPGVFLLIDGTPVWGRSGWYLYAMQVPPDDGDPLLLSGVPVTFIPSTQNEITSTDFVTNIIGPAPNVTGGPAQGVTY